MFIGLTTGKRIYGVNNGRTTIIKEKLDICQIVPTPEFINHRFIREL